MRVRKNNIVEKVKALANEFDANNTLVLFGSQATGKATRESDWDFLLLVNNEVVPTLKRRLINKLVEIEIEEEVAIQIVLKNKKEWENMYANTPLCNNISKQGIFV